MPKQTVFALVIFLHDLFTVIWIGGLTTLALVVMPSAKQILGKGPHTKRLLDAIQKRLSVLVYISIVGLWITGILLSRRSPGFPGLFQFATTYSSVLSVKHVLILAMVAITLVRSLALGRHGQPLTPSQEKLSLALLMLNLALGILVLLLTGFAAAYSPKPLPGSPGL